MAADHIRYDLLTQDALRGVVRKVLTDTAKKGLLGEHHFFITFNTQAAGVRLSSRMRAQYPEEMTVVLQYQFWDLKVTDETFEVGLSFGGVAEKLVVPFATIKSFFDPSTQFGLQFETIAEGDQDAAAPAQNNSGAAADKPSEKPKPRAPSRNPAAATSVPLSPAPQQAEPPPAAEIKSTPEKTGGEVVRLDRFRKK